MKKTLKISWAVFNSLLTLVIAAACVIIDKDVWTDAIEAE